MEQKPQLHGLITIKDGKVTKLKNVIDPNAAIVANGDPVHVLKSLADVGWKLYGEYELKIYKTIRTRLPLLALSSRIWVASTVFPTPDIPTSGQQSGSIQR